MKGFSRKGFVLLICASLLLDQNVAWRISPRCLIAAGVVLGVPAAATAVGFGAAGIGAGTFAAKMMSWTAIFSGGGVSSWSLVAFLQSVGASGLASLAMTPAGQALIAAGCLIP